MDIYLPNECLQNIFQYIDENDTKTLFSILLVNRSWCQNSVSILWKNPFNIKPHKDISIPFKIILTLLSHSNEEFIKSLKDSNRIPIPKVTTFNYLSFIKIFNLTIMCQMVNSFVKNHLNEFEVRYHLNDTVHQIVWRLIVNNSKIETLLINTIDWHSSGNLKTLFKKLPETKNCFSSLKKLFFKVKIQDLSILNDLIECTNGQVKDIELETDKRSITCLGLPSTNMIVNWIKSQKNIEKFHYKNISGNTSSIQPIIIELKNHSHSIKELKLEERCSIDVNLFEGLKNFHNLQELSLVNFTFEGNHELLAKIRFSKLKSLSLDWITSRNQQHLAYISDPIIDLIQNHASNLEHLSIKMSDVIIKHVLEKISSCCSNLKSFSCLTSDQKDMIFIYGIFKNNPNLISIDLCIIFPIRNSFLLNFAKSIPKSINNIAIGYSILGKTNIMTFLQNLNCNRLKSFKCNGQDVNIRNISEMAKTISKEKGWTIKECELGPAQYQYTYMLKWE